MSHGHATHGQEYSQQAATDLEFEQESPTQRAPPLRDGQAGQAAGGPNRSGPSQGGR